ncbi:hypothetical protein R3W88_012030 [Solanum pinnatisectum]|uniref:Uncharacterized protein n=1 Tax=Solanum pinnatisectum TaxID=50273 RepID=A0AAV9LBP8_9SOLN|nr:hypothetical protein R3W88_012030 [Solanum pinnatisectum]
MFLFSDSEDDEEDNTPLRWAIQKRMVPLTKKGKEKVVEETPTKKPSTRATTQKLMSYAMKTSKTNTTESRRRRETGEEEILIPAEGVIDISNDHSESDTMLEDITLAIEQRRKEEQGKKKTKPNSRILSIKKDIVDNLRVQKVLSGRIFDPQIIKRPSINTLADIVVIQSWNQLFMTKSPILHEEQVREFYYNGVGLGHDNGSLNTLVGNRSFHLNEERLGEILDVSREGIRYVVSQTCSESFANECAKLPKMHCEGISKKLIKGDYQLLFEFVNKVILPRSEKRIVYSVVDLFLMEALCKFELLNLLALMLDHMHKTVLEQKSKHGMRYGYFLTKVFKQLDLHVGADNVRTFKQSFSLNTLVECERIEGRTGKRSKMSQLVVEQSQLKYELEEMTVLVNKNDAEIALLKAQLAKEQTEGPGIAEVKELRMKNANLLAQNADLEEKLIKAHDTANDRLTLIIQSLTQKPPST